MKVVNLSRDGDSLKALPEHVADDADYTIVTRDLMQKMPLSCHLTISIAGQKLFTY